MAELNAAFHLYLSAENENIQYFNSQVGIESTTVAYLATRFCHCALTASTSFLNIQIYTYNVTFYIWNISKIGSCSIYMFFLISTVIGKQFSFTWNLKFYLIVFLYVIRKLWNTLNNCIKIILYWALRTVIKRLTNFFYINFLFYNFIIPISKSRYR